jgi:hypothetical protein
MSSTFVQIANRALTFLGANVITSLDDDTKEGRACKRMYEQSRAHILRDHPWNFAIRRASLAANTTSPVFEYTNAFDFPDGCLRIIEVDTEEEWAVEGRQIVTDEGAPLNIVYITDITDSTFFDPKFVEAYAMRLAADIAYDITASQVVANNAIANYRQLLQEARLVDAQESLSAKEQSWLDARN